MRLALSVFCFLILFACQSTGDKTQVIEEDKMIGIMADVYVLEMHYQKKYGAPVQYKKHLDWALKTLFASHGISRASYERSFTYYASKHEQFIHMNEEVIQRYNAELLEK
ncbi:MAG: hypothetical protein RLZZ198_1698 [Bacteroidota bacterium]|jgi:hypothetical protein